jgi:hypothetical protein
MAATFKNQIQIVPQGFEETIASLNKLTPDLKIAIMETVNKAIPFVEEQAVELILKRYRISRASLMDQSSRHGRWRFKEKKATASDLKGRLEIVGSRMPVMRFSVRPDEVPEQRGVPVSWRPRVDIQITKGGRAQRGKPNVFLAKMKTGHIGVYKRKYPNPGGPRRMRADGQPTQLPITEEYMLSVPEMLSGKKLRAKLDASLDKYVEKTLKQEIKKVSGKAWGRAKKTVQGVTEAVSDIPEAAAGIVEGVAKGIGEVVETIAEDIAEI